jgi:hypothetical protein
MKRAVTKKLLTTQKTICCLCCKLAVVAAMEGITIVAKEGTTYAIATCLVIVVTAGVQAVVAVATCFDIVVITSVHAVVAKQGACLVVVATRLLICCHSMCSCYYCHV